MDDVAASLVGASPSFLASLERLRRFAGSDATVLIEGETGTGKELAARAIHYLGARRRHPFIPVNCGALPDLLVENELFGHVRGAFTDARENRSGLIAAAEGGTLFLDEIEALTSRSQVVLLRFLQDGVYRPLGATSAVAGNVRIVAATNRDLTEIVREGGFRQDLLYRLAILSLKLPPLRERPGDATLIARHFLARFAQEYERPDPALDDDSLERLERYSWPGNVRELENVLHRSLLLSEGSFVRLELPTTPASPPDTRATEAGQLPFELGFRRAKAIVVAQFEREFLARALARCGGNVSEAARLIGKERRTMGRLMRKHSMDRQAFC